MNTVNVKNINANYDFEISGVSYIGKPLNNTVMYASRKIESLLENLNNVSECLVFVEAGSAIPDGICEKNCVVETSNPPYDYALFVSKLARAKYNPSRKFTLMDGGWYKGENVIIGENCYIEPGCVIGHDVEIGGEATILAGCKIRNSVIGNGFFANENAVIGANGFTMAVGTDGSKIRIPTLGKVVIGNNVEIGACDNISAGSSSDTIIRDYVKLDALVSVGHNDELGCGVEIPAGVILGGYDVIGANTFIGMNACLKNRITVGENCTVGMGSVINRSVKDGLTIFSKPQNVLLDSKWMTDNMGYKKP